MRVGRLSDKNVEKDVKTILNAKNEDELLDTLKKAHEARLRLFGRKICFYAPSFMYYRTGDYCSSPTAFSTISVTGKSCSLRCKHCGGKVLETMHSAVTPERLFQLCTQLKREGALGCLISGGCLPDGTVPLAKFVDTINRIKRELGLTVFVHTGITDRETAESLKRAGVDGALIDVIGSDSTIKEIYNLNVSVRDYENSLKTLSGAGITFVPHIIVGLHYGKLQGEVNALKIASEYNPSALVVIAFMPIHSTEMQDVKPPEPLDIAKIVAAARVMFPRTPLTLGCMRPKGKHRARTDVLAVKAGVNGIAFPSEEAARFAKQQGYEVVYSPFCCAKAYVDSKL